MTASCLPTIRFPNPRDYFPTKAENKANLYSLFASVLTSSLIYGPLQGAIAPLCFAMSSVCYKLVDYLGDALLKGRIEASKLQMIKSAVKVAGTVCAALISFKVFHYPIEATVVSFLIYISLTTYLGALDPLRFTPYF